MAPGYRRPPGGLLTALAFSLSKYACYEGCSGSGWGSSPDAWQWDVLQVLAIAGLACVAVALLLVAVRRYRAGFAVFAAALLAYGVFSLFLVVPG